MVAAPPRPFRRGIGRILNITADGDLGPFYRRPWKEGSTHDVGYASSSVTLHRPIRH